MQKSNVVHDGNGWETVSSETHFAAPHLTVVTDEVRTPSRSKPCKWTIAHRKAAVVVAPVTREGRFVLILQERIPIRAAIWEMPAGQVDESIEPDDNALRRVALRELQEETGYELAPDGLLVSLGHYFCSPGFTDEHCYFFLARPVHKSLIGQKHDPGEAILECREFSPDVVRKMIVGGEIRDANTLGIWARMAARGEVTGLA